MTRERCTYLFAIVASAAAVVLVPSGATAQTTYRVTDITPGFGFVGGGVGDAFVLAINALGEVAGTYQVNCPTTCEEHAFVWLPAANPNYPDLSKGFNDIHVLAGVANECVGSPPDCPVGSAALDINDSGRVVGYRIFNSREEAFVWDLTTIGVQTTALGFLATNATTFSRAWSINDTQPFQIVGVSVTDAICPPDLLLQAFISGGGPLTMADQLDPIGLEESAAYGINDSVNGIFNIAGEFINCNLLPACPVGEPGVSRSARWQASPIFFPPSPGELNQPAQFPDVEAEARAVSNSGNAGKFVGWGTDFDGLFCLRRALFWAQAPPPAPPGLGVTDLHSVVGLPPAEETRAQGINNVSPTQVVGWNDSTGAALIWEKPTSNSWTVADLNDQIGACSPNVWFIVKALDVNDAGWIVAFADNDPSQQGIQDDAVLLTPIETCLWDVAGDGMQPPDGMIGIADFLMLLGTWGPCPPGEICMTDFDCNGDVGITEFLEIIGHWGPCPGMSGEPDPSPEEAAEEAGLTEDQWDEFVDVMTDPDQPDDVKANYACWMDHYLDCHRRPFCFECACQICPDVDPFGGHF